MPRVSTSRSRCLPSLSKAIAMLQSARNETSARVALRTVAASVIGSPWLPARAPELARDRVPSEPERLRGVLAMPVLRSDRGFEQHALERGVRGRVDAGLAARERVFGPGAKSERPVGRRFARGV